MAKINFGGVEEVVVTREEFPLEKARQVLKDEVVAVLGYGVQGPASAAVTLQNFSVYRCSVGSDQSSDFARCLCGGRH